MPVSVLLPLSVTPNGQVLVAVPGLGRTEASLPPAAFDRVRAAGTTVIRVYAGDPLKSSINEMAAMIWEQVLPYCQQPVRVILMGYSMGGFVVQCMYAQRPQYVCGLAFVSTAAPTIFDLMLGVLTLKPSLLHEDNKSSRDAVRKKIRSLNYTPAVTQQMFDVSEKSRVSSAVFEKQLAACIGYIISGVAVDIVQEIGCPVLILYGSADRVIPLRSLKHITTLLSRARSVHEVILPGVSHYVMIEACQEFDAAVTDWLSSLPATCITTLVPHII
jgi:pimeloyl-ACP methyl ester carboxylesterase